MEKLWPDSLPQATNDLYRIDLQAGSPSHPRILKNENVIHCTNDRVICCEDVILSFCFLKFILEYTTEIQKFKNTQMQLLISRDVSMHELTKYEIQKKRRNINVWKMRDQCNPLLHFQCFHHVNLLKNMTVRMAHPCLPFYQPVSWQPTAVYWNRWAETQNTDKLNKLQY